MHRDGLRNPKQAPLFPDAPSTERRATVVSLSRGRCPRCSLTLDGNVCHVCASFLCKACQQWTSDDGGDGERCYLCLV